MEKKIKETTSGAIQNPVSSMEVSPSTTPGSQPEPVPKVNDDGDHEHQIQEGKAKSTREKFERINMAMIIQTLENFEVAGKLAANVSNDFNGWLFSAGMEKPEIPEVINSDEDPEVAVEDDREEDEDDNEKAGKSKDDNDDDHIQLENHGETSKETPLMGEKDEGIEAKFDDSIEEDDVFSVDLEQPGILTLSGSVDDSMDNEGEAKGQIQENDDDNVAESAMEIQNVYVVAGGGDHAELDNMPAEMEEDVDVTATEAPLSPVAGPSSRILQLRKDLGIVNPLRKN